MQVPGAGYTDRAFTRADLDYALPAELIAQQPLPQRDQARMLVLDRERGTHSDRRVTDLPELLRPGDLLVLNDTKVVPARFSARRKTGGRVSGLFLEETGQGRWRVMLEGSRRLRVGEALAVTGPDGPTVQMVLAESLGGGEWGVEVGCDEPAEQTLARIGQTPLPPYIRREPHDPQDAADRIRYQTVYATRPGAVAAPTAGLHLTDALLEAVCERGVELAYVTLHVGPGTFKPVSASNLAQHVMHAERYEVPEETARAVDACRGRGGSVVAVGTTTVRVLETVARTSKEGTVAGGAGVTKLFICPRYSFRVVDGLLTNFHLPHSTLLALVMAFAGVEAVRRAYERAVAERYRFYSFGDAMFIR